LSNAGAVLRELDQLDDAERLLRRSYDLQRAQFGVGHPKSAKTLNNLAGIYEQRPNSEGSQVFVSVLLNNLGSLEGP